MTFVDGPAGGDQRAVRLAADGVGRLLVHGDLLRRRDELETIGLEAGGTEQHRLDLIGTSLDRAGNDLLRPAVSPERIDRNPDRHARESTALRGRRPERLDLAPAVRLAVRAHLVRALRMVTVRTDAQARRLDAVLRATLVAPG